MSSSYVNFNPRVITVQQPRAMVLGAPQTQSASVPSVEFPVSVVIDLSLIDGTGKRDYFLAHPSQASVQQILLGADEDVDAPAGFTIQLIQFDGRQEKPLTAEKSVRRFTIAPITLPLPASVGTQTLFLRVKAPTTSRVIYATAHMLTSEVN